MASCFGCLVCILAVMVCGGVAVYIGEQSGGPEPPPANDAVATANEQSRQSRQTATQQRSQTVYTVTNEESFGEEKLSLEIRLERRVSEEELKEIAMELKNARSEKYKRTFIGYHVAGMPTNTGYWATTHFNPDLEVRILGLSPDEVTDLSTKPEVENRDEIGRWLDDRPFLGKRVVIFRENGKLFMESTYDDGSSGIKELVESKSALGRRFQELRKSTAGDHWILDSNGDLQLRDDEGLISTAKKIQ